MNIPTPDQIAKLPKWAQDYVKDLNRRMTTAEKELKEQLDSQTPSEFYIDDLLCIGDGSPQFARKYVQTHKISVEHDGVKLDVLVRGPEDPGIDISWGCSKRLMTEVALIPLSFQKMKIVPKDKMR